MKRFIQKVEKVTIASSALLPALCLILSAVILGVLGSLWLAVHLSSQEPELSANEDNAESKGAASTITCKGMQAIHNLDVGKLKGKWYEWSSFGTALVFPDHRCQVGFWYLGSGGNSITVLNDLLKNDADSQARPEQKRYTWNITFEGPSPDGKLVASVDTLSLGHQILPMYVLDTDYTSYLLIHMCKKIANSDYAAGLVLTRRKSYSIENIMAMEEKINKTLKTNGIKLSEFKAAIQSKCVKVKFPESYDVLQS